MSDDPHSNQNPERPDYANPDSYETPSTPYEAANPYETPNAAYDPLPNTPYSAPEAPYGTGIPSRGPLPLGEAIRELPNQYIRVITRPGTAVFAEEQGKAAWNIVWVQLIILAVISSLVGLAAFNVSLGNSTAASQQMLQSFRAYSGAFAILFLVFTPIGFFIGAGLYHLIAKAFGGRGTFLAYCYSYLLIGVPLSIVSGLLNLIPFVGSFIAIAVSVYQIVLQVYMTMAVHRLSGGKATLAVLILPIVGVIIGIIVGIVVAAAFLGGAHSG